MTNTTPNDALVLSQTAAALQTSADDAVANPAHGALTAQTQTPVGPGTPYNREDFGLCCHDVKLAIFFDGTGNNMDADLPSRKHSNVARLFRAHPLNDSVAAHFAIYVAGLGTYMADIGDPGGNLGSGFARYGEARLEWAFAEITRVLTGGDPQRGQAGYAPWKIRKIDLALFGFSRGATEARAFANLLQQRSKADEHGNRSLDIKGAQVPIRIYFMGLFDTVASVGIPASASANSSGQSLTGWLGHTLDQRRLSGETPTRHMGKADSGLPAETGNGLQRIAWGQAAGANPVQGTWGDGTNGHGSWVQDYGLAIPPRPFVAQCLHLVAAHEIRNSFPLDSVRVGAVYPDNCTEVVYPGSHSDVGGGYRAGEQGKSLDDGSKLSQITLYAMYQTAVSVGVPLEKLGSLHDLTVERDFVIDSKLIQDFNQYCQLTGLANASAPLGQLVNTQMQHWQHWRLWRMAHGRDAQLAAIAQQEAQYKAEHARIQAELDAEESNPARLKAVNRYQDCRDRAAQLCSGRSPTHEAVGKAWDELDEAEREWRTANDPWNRIHARLEALPKYEGQFSAALQVYDRALLKDLAYLTDPYNAPTGKPPLRPHYARLVAVADLVARQQGPAAQIADFFDRYVHDSLAGFAGDATLPSDPRIHYLGGDLKSLFGQRQPDVAQTRTAIV
ncbi:hypothetical protein HNQ50_000096 [Silvimonas terrae]|uniref:T6SS Phospholipase effector Tle1-like catalytic domain-containing protein n=1 Tax=Silvimonas terrae TaxID=300266 RepID=A0A840RAA6_9NEIS|nr:DUF2235 domain-containing protein [Silvimonas terrae]MBB5189386.1 hypothetical protein [Silvimonas terrae]